MNAYDACEQAYRNGFNKGYESGIHVQEDSMLKRFEETFGEQCTCGETYFTHHNYCPYCGRKLWEGENT